MTLAIAEGIAIVEAVEVIVFIGDNAREPRLVANDTLAVEYRGFRVRSCDPEVEVGMVFYQYSGQRMVSISWTIECVKC